MRYPHARLKWILPALLTTLAGCTSQAGPADAGAPPPPQVDVVEVTPRPLPITREYIGRTRGSREVEIRPRVSGLIQERFFTEGDRVEAGQPLYQIDPRPYQAAVAVAEAELARAVAQQHQAERDLTRLRPLAAERAASRKDLDDANSARELADAAVRSAQARLQQAQLDLEFSRLTAPFTGVAGLAERAVGALVNAGTDRLTTLTQDDPMDLFFSISENAWLAHQQALSNGRVATPERGLTVRARLADGRTLDRTGTVDYSDPRIDPDTGTVTMRARMPNADGLLKAGQFVRVILTGEVRPQAITLPQKAILEGPTGKFVYVVGRSEKGGVVAEFRPVVVGDWITAADGARLWLVHQGLAKGERVIVDNLIKVRPGAPVQVREPARTDATATPQG